MKQEIKTTQPDSKEGLHTQGDKWEVRVFDKLVTIGSPERGDGILTVTSGNFKQCKEDAELIVKAVNERPELIKQRDEAIKELNYMVQEDQKHREETVKAVNERKALLDALKACYNCLTMDSDMEEDFAPEIKQVKKLLDKAGW